MIVAVVLGIRKKGYGTKEKDLIQQARTEKARVKDAADIERTKAMADRDASKPSADSDRRTELLKRLRRQSNRHHRRSPKRGGSG
jgi:hypothetical protein